MRKYFTEHLKQFHKESRKSSMILNSSLNFVYPIFQEDFISGGHKKEDFDDFFKSVFKNIIEKMRC